ncbi:hypothetical protein OKA06_14585 [Novosphingobium sp. MW5]|nr:hypothetical protein [Novosphingobium sp. MW5]
MRRALVVTDEAARHPFRMSLPPYVCRGTAAAPARAKARFTLEDLKLFLMAYSACLLAVTTFIG